MTKYIKLDDAIAAFKQIEIKDAEDMIKNGIFDDCLIFDSYRAIEAVNNLHIYIGIDKNESEN